MQLAPSLRRLGSSSPVNSYLVEDAGELTVIDAGLPGLWKDLLAELRGMGLALQDIRAVLLTHGDVDHIGFAERLRRVSPPSMTIGGALATVSIVVAPWPPAQPPTAAATARRLARRQRREQSILLL